MGRALWRIGAWIMIGLGAGHGAESLADVWSPTLASPVVPSVRAAMERTPVAIASWLGSEATIWNGSVGWNISMGMGMAFIGAVALACTHRPALRRSITPVVLPVVVAFAVLAAAFWFWVPLAGFVLSAIALGAATVLLRDPPALAAPATSRRPWLVAGVLPFLLAGSMHFIGTFADLFGTGPFAPTDLDVRAQMLGSDIAAPLVVGVHRDAWTAYVGFNFGHGLGAATFAVLTTVLARRDPTVPLLRWLPLAMALGWLTLAITCWFWLPAVAIAAGVVALLIDAVRYDSACGRASPSRS